MTVALRVIRSNRAGSQAPTTGGRRERAGTPTPLWRDSFDSLYPYNAPGEGAGGRGQEDPDLIELASDQDDDEDDPFRMPNWMSVGRRMR